MRESIMEKLLTVTDEENYYLSGHKDVQKGLYQEYADGRMSEIDAHKFLNEGRLITVRHHSRFVDFPEHAHNYVEFMYVCSGTITHVIDGQEICMQAGDLLMMNQSVRHAVKKAGKNDIGINFIVLPEFFDIPLDMLQNSHKANVIVDFLASLFREKNSLAQYLWFRLGDFWEIDNLMENLVGMLLDGQKDDGNQGENKNSQNSQDKGRNKDSQNSQNQGGNKDRQNREGQDNQIFYQYTMGLIFLALTHHIESLQTHSSQDYKELLVQSALHFIDNNYQTANLTKVADDFHVSVSFASRLIKESTGYTFQQILVQKRFHRAVMLLMETDLSIEEIIYRVGYENISYFFREFKRRYQMTPGRFRIEHKNDKSITI